MGGRRARQRGAVLRPGGPDRGHARRGGARRPAGAGRLPRGRCARACAPRRRRRTRPCGARSTPPPARRAPATGARSRPRAGLPAPPRSAAPTRSRSTARAAATPPRPRSWLLLRDFRTATRFTRPGADATTAVDRLAKGKLAPGAARLAIAKDLLDAYQARLRELLKDVDATGEKGFGTRAAESAAQAAGYWQILAPRYRQDRGEAAAGAAAREFADLRASAAQGDREGVVAARAEIDTALDGFTAAPFTAEESARRAQQLLRFVALVPVEYGRGVKDGRVTLDFEVQEAIAFQTASDAAFDDLRDQLAKRDRRARPARSR